MKPKNTIWIEEKDVSIERNRLSDNISELLEWIKKSANTIVDSCDKVKSEKRLILLRHWSTLEDEDNVKNWKKSSQSENAILSEIWKKQIEDAAKSFLKLGMNKNNTLFIFSDDTVRVVDSLKILLKYFDTESPEAQFLDARLSTSRKIKDEAWSITSWKWEKRLLSDWTVFMNTVSLMQDLRDWKIWRGKRFIVMVWHKSNKWGFTQSFENINEGIRIDYDISNGWIVDIDVWSDWEWYWCGLQTPVLRLTSNNIDWIIESLPWGEKIYKLISSKWLSIIDIQNDLNSFLKSDKRYLSFLQWFDWVKIL